MINLEAPIHLTPQWAIILKISNLLSLACNSITQMLNETMPYNWGNRGWNSEGALLEINHHCQSLASPSVIHVRQNRRN